MSKSARGFTLVELLVVIAIIAVLSVAGVTIFTGVQKNARDSKRRADIEAIAKAYEVGYNGRYFVLNADSFSEGSLPDDPAKGDYFNWLDAEGRGFKVCASLENNPNAVCNTPAQNCYCQFSSQGTITPSSTPDSSSKQTNIGFGGSSASACDPNGTLNAGLAAYWKMDEGLETQANDSSGNGNNITAFAGNTAWETGECKSGSCLKFGNGQFDYIYKPISGSSTLNLGAGDFTISAWVKVPQPQNFGSGLFGQYPHNSSVYNGRFVIGILDNRTELFFYHRNNNGAYDSVRYNFAPYFNNLTFIALIKSGNKKYLYINGGDPKLTGTIAIPYDINFSGGTYSISGTGWSPGIMSNLIVDEHRIYNRALSKDEVNILASGCVP